MLNQAEYGKRWRRKHPVTYTLMKIRWYTRRQHEWDHKLRRHRCGWLTSMAIRHGIIARPTHCQSCGTGCKPNAHHDDYSQVLDVRFYCRSCHNEADKAREERLGIERVRPTKRHDLTRAEHNRAHRLWASGKYSQRQIGRLVGIDNSTVSKIVRGLTQPRLGIRREPAS